jgi:DivIVA domain-containing protein
MALTPEDVVNKRFQPTKFREGYDQDEVDDFLDEVVVELRRLNQENEELRQRLGAGGGQESSSQKTDEAPVATPAPEPVAAVPAPVAASAPEPVAAAPAPTSIEDESLATTNLLVLAQRLHEEHVREGIEKRDSLIADAHATAARLLADAEAKQREQLNAFEEERSVLESRIEELSIFEREYRQKLKSYIEGQLRDLEAPQGSLSESSSNVSGFAGN